MPAHRYRKLKDLLMMCRDGGSVDVVIKSVGSLCEVFCEIIPSYRIRDIVPEEEKKEEKKDENKDNNKGKEKKKHV